MAYRSKLTKREQIFVDEYLVDLNASKAAERAGYSPKSAHVTGCRLLKEAKIAAAIQEARNAMQARTHIDQDRVLQELARVGLSDVRRLFTKEGALRSVHELDDDVAAAVSSVEVVQRPGGFDEEGNREIEHVHKIRLWDKNSALEKIGKHLAMFTDRSEVTGAGGGPIHVMVQRFAEDD